ncbi:hypothetical protein V9T40_008646 [Parthenolecanium corni]|uniref:Uncharacterized protein n=1 Tax=Parthenolecanium corni TaxID=536013 RepID=A0AAN9Y8A6_9HEMI
MCHEGADTPVKISLHQCDQGLRYETCERTFGMRLVSRLPLGTGSFILGLFGCSPNRFPRLENRSTPERMPRLSLPHPLPRIGVDPA